MIKPEFINLQPDEYFASLGWDAVERDRDGHTVSVRGKFRSWEEMIEYQAEAARAGNAVTWLRDVSRMVSAPAPGDPA